jgi:hypothetical protein
MKYKAPRELSYRKYGFKIDDDKSLKTTNHLDPEKCL